MRIECCLVKTEGFCMAFEGGNGIRLAKTATDQQMEAAI
jgi:hypothetical protein